ncbi:hypothetical protein VTL71DRAFT_2447 [Oculimacula yallundae]|uniref:Secreted protein n=1 Tax=Oculimacula yallundae TaxID=86028 RepID=A0ABR4CAU5_9HELO
MMVLHCIVGSFCRMPAAPAPAAVTPPQSTNGDPILLLLEQGQDAECCHMRLCSGGCDQVQEATREWCRGSSRCRSMNLVGPEREVFVARKYPAARLREVGQLQNLTTSNLQHHVDHSSKYCIRAAKEFD